MNEIVILSEHFFSLQNVPSNNSVSHLVYNALILWNTVLHTQYALVTHSITFSESHANTLHSFLRSCFTFNTFGNNLQMQCVVNTDKAQYENAIFSI